VREGGDLLPHPGIFRFNRVKARQKTLTLGYPPDIMKGRYPSLSMHRLL
jgi:hypothetical protein